MSTSGNRTIKPRKNVLLAQQKEAEFKEIVSRLEISEGEKETLENLVERCPSANNIWSRASNPAEHTE